MINCRIEKIENKLMTLIPIDSKQENKCASCRGCGMFKKNIAADGRITIKAEDANNYNTGDEVTVSTDSKLYVKAAAMLFLTPVLLLIFCVSIFDNFFSNETYSLIAALIAVLIYYILIKSKLNFQIYRIEKIIV